MLSLIFLLATTFLCRLDVGLAAVTDPTIINWVQCTGKKGYSSQLSDVQKVEYSTSYVYITSTSIPGTYTVGGAGWNSSKPWADDPYTPVAQPTFRVQIPRSPVIATTTTAVPMGTFGIMLNGVSLYNSNDGNVYTKSGTTYSGWYRNAAFFELYSFDSCLGHASVGTGTVTNGLYHHHSLPICFSTANTTGVHSPLLGYAFDGFPIYGPYGYTTATGSSASASAIKSLTSCYSAYSYPSGLRTVYGDTNGVTAASPAGPPTSQTYQVNTYSSTLSPVVSGALLRDWYYNSANLGTSCDLNAFNGRIQNTPEYPYSSYPSGIFCYIMPAVATETLGYPYIIGPGNYYGQVSSTSTYVTVSETTTVYFLYSSAPRLSQKSVLSLMGFSLFYIFV